MKSKFILPIIAYHIAYYLDITDVASEAVRSLSPPLECRQIDLHSAANHQWFLELWVCWPCCITRETTSLISLCYGQFAALVDFFQIISTRCSATSDMNNGRVGSSTIIPGPEKPYLGSSAKYQSQHRSHHA